MPEGPSIVILKEQVQRFRHKKVIAATGSAKIDLGAIEGRIVTDFKTWGKHLLICFSGFTIRIHLLLFGSYRINGKKDAPPRLSLTFNNGEMNFYSCSVQIIDAPPDEVYDWEADIMSDKWNAAAAKAKLQAKPGMLACDALLDQHIFSGSGNIIKNEVLFRTRIHPLSAVGSLPANKLSELVRETHDYAFDFLKWKKADELKKHWLAYAQKTCPRCHIPLLKEYLGTTRRRSFFCNNCQVQYH